MFVFSFYQRPNVYYPSYQPYYHSMLQFREFPPVNTTLLKSSVKNMEEILTDATKILRHISTETTFAKELMTAAQLSKTETVKALITNIGVKHIPTIYYNPDGIHLSFVGKQQNLECCKLDLAIRWRT